MTIRTLRLVLALALATLLPALAAQPGNAREGRVLVAVAEGDLDPIVRAVGGAYVDTQSLFRGCVLRKDLQVEVGARARLASAEAIVWTGFLNESAAISEALRQQSGRKGQEPKWIDVSKGAVRKNVPSSSCFGYVDPAFAAGDPFFWLNPENGSVIAKNIARGLAELRPAFRAQFMANADAFKASLAQDIHRWKTALKPLHGLRVFTAQCGWQHLSILGGPEFVVCKGTPGELPSPQTLLLHIKQMKAELILVDPNTPAEYAEAFREQSGLKVIEVPSSIESLKGAATYQALFDNLVKAVLAAHKH